MSLPKIVQFGYTVDKIMHMSGADPEFFKRGGAKIKDRQNLWGQGVSEGDVPPQKQRKIVSFKVNLHDLVHSFCLGCPHKVRRTISAKNRGSAHRVHPL